MSLTPDNGPVLALAWEPLSATPVWQGPAAAARGKLEQGTYFAPDQIVGITGEGVLVTDENTGRSAYFLATADAVEQHLADLSYQILTAVPDAYEWAAPSLHDAYNFTQEVIAVRTIDGSHHTFELGPDGLDSIRALQKLQLEQPLDLPNPVHVDTALREHVAFLVEVGAVGSGAEAPPPDGYNRISAAGRVLEGMRPLPDEQDQLAPARYGQSYSGPGRDAVQRLADDARQGRYWTQQFIRRFAGELETVHYPANIARTAAREHVEQLDSWQTTAQAVIHAGTAPGTLQLLVTLAEAARRLRGGDEPIPGTVDRWQLAATLAVENPHIETRGQAEMRADLITMRDPDITNGVMLAGATFKATGTRAARADHRPPADHPTTRPYDRPTTQHER